MTMKQVEVDGMIWLMTMLQLLVPMSQIVRKWSQFNLTEQTVPTQTYQGNIVIWPLIGYWCGQKSSEFLPMPESKRLLGMIKSFTPFTSTDHLTMPFTQDFMWLMIDSSNMNSLILMHLLISIPIWDHLRLIPSLMKYSLCQKSAKNHKNS